MRKTSKIQFERLKSTYSVADPIEAIVWRLIYQSLDDAVSVDFLNHIQSVLSGDLAWKTCQAQPCVWSRHL